MKNLLKLTLWMYVLMISAPACAWTWQDLWHTGDQQGMQLLQAGKAEKAAKSFKNPQWQSVALYRSGNYTAAFQQFSRQKTSDNQYNAGNAAAYLGHYQDAIAAYDKALALNSNNTDAITNREIIKKLLAKKNQSQNNSANNSQKATENKAKDNKASEQPQNSAENNSAPKNINATPKTQTTSQPSSPQKSGQQEPKNTIQQTLAAHENQTSAQTPAEQKSQNPAIAAQANSQNQEEDKKQLLRRLDDDPGGLLRQKFQRDYYRRHMVVENSDQGEN